MQIPKALSQFETLASPRTTGMISVGAGSRVMYRFGGAVVDELQGF